MSRHAHPHSRAQAEIGVSPRDFLRAFSRIGLLSFGGPAAQMALMHRVLVDEEAWLTDSEYLSALSFCMMLPGPEAMQLTTYCGWKLKGIWGGIAAGLLFVLPGAAVMMVLAIGYAAVGQTPAVEALFVGLKATVIVLVGAALLRLGRKTLITRDAWALAVLAFVGIGIFNIPFPAVILASALYGAWRGPHTPQPTHAATAQRPANTHLLRTIAIWGGLWAAPLVVLWALDATQLLDIGLFFSKLATVSFGGAYAVLAYMSQQAVEYHAWLTAAQMLDGLGLAETTPGPLILVTQFVGYLAGFANGGGLGMGLLAAALTLWVTFIPCYLWIFAGAPYIEWIGTKPRLSAALRAITAAVVGVIASLAVWFATHVFFTEHLRTTLGPWTWDMPRLASVDPISLALVAFAAVLLTATRLSLLPVLAVTVAVGLGLPHVLALVTSL